jgi:Pro-kumamolisin, activation domain
VRALRTVVALLGLLAVLAGAGAAGAQGRGEARRVVMLGLLRPEQELARFVDSVSEPGSAAYGHYLTLGRLRSAYGARPAVARRVLAFLRRSTGVRSARLDSTGTVVLATMTAPASRRLFCARGMRSPRRGLCRPRPLRRLVTEVLAGEVYTVGRPSRRPARRASARSGTPQGCRAALESGTLTPNQLASAYEVDPLAARGLDGGGVRVDTLSSALVAPGALRAWARCFGLPSPRFHQVAMPSAGRDTSTAPEETYLDAEALASLAPGLGRITAITVPLDSSFRSAFPLFMLGALDPARQGGRLPDVLSVSDGVCESQLAAADRRLGQHLLRDAAALGITALAASGDLGFQGCQERGRGAEWPGSSRYVTSVGGTEVTLDPQNALLDQVVWSTFGTEGEGNGTGSGGGPSAVWPRPAWQQAPGIGPPLQPSGSTRLTPDLAAMGSFTPGLATYGGGEGWGPGGGTSAATPLTAAILALALQQERLAGRPALGALDPLLYALARGPGYASVFRDVTQGTSSPRPQTPLGSSPAGGAAQPGYDLATGLGSLRAEAFAAALAAR